VYLAHGKVDFFGEEAMARTGGAGGQNRTMLPRYFLRFRSPFRWRRESLPPKAGISSVRVWLERAFL
jgi:hypothetical protein